MPLNYKANASAGDFEPVPAGSHIAVCDIVADIGLQPGSTLFPKPKQQVYIRFQIPAERVEFTKDGKTSTGPAVIGKTYTGSMNEKATLRHHLESWRGRQFTDEEAEAFDVSAILGKPCMLTVMHTQKDGKTYANIAGVGGLPKGIDAKSLKPESTPLLYSAETPGSYAQLPEWLRKKIDGQILEKPAPRGDSASAWDGAEPDHQDGGALEITDDDIPF